jgi:serine/threonine-protein kinase
MCRFLRYIVEETLSGRGETLKEYGIGVAVFDRRQSFDPRTEPIVRVEARRLRAKLDAYYESEGKTAELRVELPKGTYVPRFRTAGMVTRPSAPLVSQVRTVAVLPFVNASRDPDNDYLSDGLTQELIHGLTKLEGVRVVAWNTASQVRASQHDLSNIGRQLRVEAVLKGTLRCSADRLRVQVQLVDTVNGYYLWSETFDRRAEDLFKIEDDISRAVVDALQVQLGVRRLRDYNPRAYNLYIRGRYHWNQRTYEGLERAIGYFREAVSMDPTFAHGYAGLADSYVLLADYGFTRPADVVDNARRAAQKALEIDPTLGEAEASLGLISSIHEWRWAEGEQHYLRAIQLNPGYATAFHWYGIDYLALLGRFEDGFRAIHKALDLDPLSRIIVEGRGYLFMLSGMYAEAKKSFEELLDLDPFFYKAYTTLGRVYIQTGEYHAAIEMLEEGRRLAGDIPSIIGALGQAYAMAGRKDEAERLLGQLSRMATVRYVPCSCFAVLHLGLNEHEKALEWLERGCNQRDSSMSAIGVHPVYRPLRSHPRFRVLLTRVGLAERFATA